MRHHIEPPLPECSTDVLQAGYDGYDPELAGTG
jgi:hypothetical protein